MTAETFRDLEQQGWTSKAEGYEAQFTPITKQAIAPLLDALAPDLTGRDLLDVCTGTGHIAGAAAARGAWVEGIDFAETMLAIARASYPAVRFQAGDALHLPHAGGAFDFVTNGFGLWHLEDPVAALVEAARVLRPGGRLAFTTWLAPERGFDLWRIVIAAVREHGTLDVPIPPSPPPFRFSEPAECRRVLSEVGFAAVTAVERPCTWSGRDGQALLDLLYESIVRAPMLIERQAPRARERILASIVQRAEACRRGDRIELGFPYLLVAATRRA